MSPRASGNPTAHRLQPGARPAHTDLDLAIPVALIQDREQSADPLVGGGGARFDREGPPPEDLALLASISGQPRVLQGSLVVQLARRGSTLPEPDHADEAAALGETQVVSPLLEPPDVALDLGERLQLVDVRVQQQPDEDPPHAGASLQDGVTDGPSALDRLGQDGLRSRDVGLPERHPKVSQEVESARIVRRQEVHGSRQQVLGRREVPVRERPAAGRGQPFGGRLGDRARLIVDRSELGLVPVRVFEVVADDLLELGDPVARLAFEPAGETLMQVRPRPLRHRTVRRVADQDVAEPERVLPREPRPIGVHELLAQERLQVRADARTVVLR